MSSGIYEIVNTINGHRYIGSAKNINDRWYLHKHYLEKNKHHSQHLQNAWNKYGKNLFEFRVIEHCFFFMLIPREQYYIDTLKPEYNIAQKAGSSIGIKRTEETKARMSEAMKISKGTQIAKNKSSEAQKKRYAENPITKETKNKMSIAKKNHTITQETRIKMSESAKKAKASPEARAKQSQAIKLWWSRRKQQESD